MPNTGARKNLQKMWAIKCLKKSLCSSSCSFNYHINMYYSNQVACLLDEMKVFFFDYRKKKKLPKETPKRKQKLVWSLSNIEFFFLIFFRCKFQLIDVFGFASWMPWEDEGNHSWAARGELVQVGFEISHSSHGFSDAWKDGMRFHRFFFIFDGWNVFIMWLELLTAT